MFSPCSDHWRKNMPYLARNNRVFAIDLLGYGYSDKPNPRDFPEGSLYTFETWAQQLLDFCEEFTGGPAFMICNSVGGELNTLGLSLRALVGV
jgi:pimeloyl-ACP methyl ester carboxylesterase